MQSNPDAPFWLQLDLSIVMLQLSEKVPDVVLATEAEGHESCLHLLQSEGVEQLYALQRCF